ncbi:MAG: hypothetical protein WCG26_00175 [Chloroflexales bacterium]
MTPSAYNAICAAAIKSSSAIATSCTTKWGMGCLVQDGENPADPLSLADCPWICCLVWPTAELGAIVDANSCEIVLTAGVGPLPSVEAPALPTIGTERTPSTNGIRTYGNAADAEGLLLLAIEAAKAACPNGAIVAASRIETDNWMHYPLQIASAVLTIREYNTL